MPEQDLLKELFMVLSNLDKMLAKYFDDQSVFFDKERENWKQNEKKFIELQSNISLREKSLEEKNDQIKKLESRLIAIENSLSDKNEQIKVLKNEVEHNKKQLGIEKNKNHNLHTTLSKLEISIREEQKKQQVANVAKDEAEELAHQYNRQYEDLHTKIKEAPEIGVRDFLAKVDQDGYALAKLWNSDAKSSKGAVSSFRDALIRLGIQSRGVLGDEIEISTEEDLNRFRMHVSAPPLPFKAHIISPGFMYRNRNICLPEIDPVL